MKKVTDLLFAKVGGRARHGTSAGCLCGRGALVCVCVCCPALCTPASAVCDRPAVHSLCVCLSRARANTQTDCPPSHTDFRGRPARPLLRGHVRCWVAAQAGHDDGDPVRWLGECVLFWGERSAHVCFAALQSAIIAHTHTHTCTHVHARTHTHVCA